MLWDFQDEFEHMIAYEVAGDIEYIELCRYVIKSEYYDKKTHLQFTLMKIKPAVSFFAEEVTQDVETVERWERYQVKHGETDINAEKILK